MRLSKIIFIRLEDYLACVPILSKIEIAKHLPRKIRLKYFKADFLSQFCYL